MADHLLETRVWVGRPRPEVFGFFADPSNLARLTPPSLRLTVRQAPAVLHAGAVLDYEMRWLGVPVRWRAFVREFDAPYRFLDVQVRGPYARWEHRHRFLEADGGTVIDDRIVYRLPLGAAGRLVHTALVRRQLAAAWRHRTRRLAQLLGPVRPVA